MKIMPFQEFSFVESSDKDNENLDPDVVFSVSPYRLYQLYLKAIKLFPMSGLLALPEVRTQDDCNFLSLSDQDIQHWLREIQPETLVTFLKYTEGDIQERVYLNMSLGEAETLWNWDDEKWASINEVDGKTAKAKMWGALDQLQKDGGVFNLRGDLTRQDETGEYCLNFGCGSITLSSDDVVSFMQRQYPKLLELSEHGRER